MNPIIVKRQPADKPGPEISDPLITSEPVAIAHATAKIDHNFSDRTAFALNCGFIDYIPWGEIGRVDKDDGGRPGMATDYEINLSLSGETYTIDTMVTVESEVRR